MKINSGIIIALLLFLPANSKERPLTFQNNVNFSGEVSKGQKFEKKFGGIYTFILNPIEYGWSIKVTDDRNSENIARLTPPFHFVPNPRYIEGWHFRNSDNSGPNDIGPKNVNAPGEVRRFIFSPEVGRSIQGHDSKNSISSDDVTTVERFGQGTLTIKNYTLNNLSVGEKAGIENMQFSVLLEWDNRK